MRLVKIQAGNFGSYEHLEFDFRSSGLTLIQGATGSGKSTLFDAATWVLYGVTAKDGSVDDVRSWNDISLPTIGVLTVEVNDEILHVTRVRGKPNENDLYWTEEDKPGEHRGTNIRETQGLIDSKLGLDSSAYLAAAYYCEYSPSAAFFVNNSKQRRQLFDRVAHLDFPTQLAETLTAKIKNYKAVLLKSEQELASLKRQITLSENNFKDVVMRRENWDNHLIDRIALLQEKAKNFESDKIDKIASLKLLQSQYEADRLSQIEELKHAIEAEIDHNALQTDQTCPTCGHNPSKSARPSSKLNERRLVQLYKEINPYTSQVDYISSSVNDAMGQVELVKKEINPFIAQLGHFEAQGRELRLNHEDEQVQYEKDKDKLSQFNALKELSGVLKEQLLTNAVSHIESMTNTYLREYFEGELTVAFELDGADALEVKLYKNGHEAVYKQLSKGQRQLLKLTFSIAVMQAVANRTGVKITSLFFDEALDGLDTNFKVKAFNLFSSLELTHESIFIIDHAEEFKNLFNNQYLVEIEADKSTIIDAQSTNERKGT